MIGYVPVRVLRQARCDDQGDSGLTSVDFSGQSQAIHRTWHVDVGEQDVHGIRVGLQDAKGLVGAGRLDDIIARLGQQAGWACAEEILVVDQQHGSSECTHGLAPT